MTDERLVESDSKKRRIEGWKSLAFFAAFSVGEIWAWARDDWSLDKRADWIFAGGAIFFPVLTLLSALSLVRKWSPAREDRIMTKTFGWMIGGPILAGLGIWALVSVWGWFGSIPSWAGVIIVLLVLILLQQRK